MAVIVGLVGALVAGVFATKVGLDRERGFYPTITIMIALLYVLFGAIGGSGQALVVEVMIATAFIVAATWGFRRSPWIVVAALAMHGVMDLFHPALVDNPGVPPWWPAFCSTYDVVAAAYLAWRLRRASGARSHLRGQPRPELHG
jgi:hypothetical protein